MSIFNAYKTKDWVVLWLVLNTEPDFTPLFDVPTTLKNAERIKNSDLWDDLTTYLNVLSFTLISYRIMDFSKVKMFKDTLTYIQGCIGDTLDVLDKIDEDKLDSSIYLLGLMQNDTNKVGFDKFMKEVNKYLDETN